MRQNIEFSKMQIERAKNNIMRNMLLVFFCGVVNIKKNNNNMSYRNGVTRNKKNYRIIINK